MGRPFSNELSELKKTYSWAIKQPTDEMWSFLEDGRQIIVIGSGGSLTAASLLALLYREMGFEARVATPFEFYQSAKLKIDVKVVLISASGNNKDILMAYMKAREDDIADLMAVCMRRKSKVQKLVDKYRYGKVVTYCPPVKKDGFLATNSLLAYVVLFGKMFGNQIKLRDVVLSREHSPEVINTTSSISQINTVSVVYGKWGWPVALDIESKCSEAALSSALLADFRNFGHGRHHWFDKQNDNSILLALVTPDEKEIADRTLALLPSSVNIVRIDSSLNGPAGTAELLVKAMYFIEEVGKVKGIDPGRPGVPDFGRKMYSLSVPPRKRGQSRKGMTKKDELAISRKLQGGSIQDLPPISLKYFKQGLERFKKKLVAASFGAVVVDYDGTICDSDNRWLGPGSSTQRYLIKLVKGGVRLGVATGRGKSVRIDLQKILPQKYWSQVEIGYYNCSQIGFLSDNNMPNKKRSIDPALSGLYEEIQHCHAIVEATKVKLRPNQLSIFPSNPALWPFIRSQVSQMSANESYSSLRILESSHSMDIIPYSVSKVNLVERISHSIGRELAVLRVGDKGRWPGNDYELLSHEFSLSVDEVPCSHDSCYNLAPNGVRGEAAFVKYCQAFEINDGCFSIKLKDVK